MLQGNLIRKTLLLICLILAFSAFPSSVSISEDKPLKGIETLYSTISYSRDEDLYEFGRKIGAGAASLNRDKGQAAPFARESLDRIVYRVKVILDMYPTQFHFNILIYPAYNDLKESYRLNGITGKAPIAFYSHRTMTIYVSLENLTDRILAHEIAHAVINNYFSTPPPGQMQEILAQYVDRHLWDD